MAGPQIIGEGVAQKDDFPPEKARFQNGFVGMRRREMLDFIQPFVEAGTIPPVGENVPREKLLPMLEQYREAGYFGTDPFGQMPSDDRALAAVSKVNDRMDRIEANQDRMMGLLENALGGHVTEGEGDGDGTPPTTPETAAEASPSADDEGPDLAALARPTPIDLQALPYRELQKLGNKAGLAVVGVSREKIEEQLAPIMEKARQEA